MSDDDLGLAQALGEAHELLGALRPHVCAFLRRLLLLAIDDPLVVRDARLQERLMLVPRLLRGLDVDLLRRLPATEGWARRAIDDAAAALDPVDGGEALARLCRVSLEDPRFLWHFLRESVKVADEKA